MKRLLNEVHCRRFGRSSAVRLRGLLARPHMFKQDVLCALYLHRISLFCQLGLTSLTVLRNYITLCNLYLFRISFQSADVGNITCGSSVKILI